MTILRDAIGELEKVKVESEIRSALCVVSSIIGADNIAYMASTELCKRSDGTVRFVTYSKEWEKRYFDREYLFIDPVAQGMENQLPFDWNFSSNIASNRWFFAEAESFGVAGRAFPLQFVENLVSVPF